ncbi:OsmC family peroxiredoxin [Thermoleophilia bacterium SCSIO 60948]|nr:OsmC family peroxiredoxin [Thermoleophilia bacterium SCSIO 60948]
MSPQRHDATVEWTGSTGAGWSGYGREHHGSSPGTAQEIGLTTGESHGDPSLHNPEQLVVIAASSCQMLVFLHLAAKARIDIVGYRDSAAGFMSEEGSGPQWIERIELRPRIEVAGDADAPRERLERLAELAHEHCYVANSLRSEVDLKIEIDIAATGTV